MLSDPAQACGRFPNARRIIRLDISGPLLDRFDIHIDVAAVSARDLALPPPCRRKRCDCRARGGGARRSAKAI
jgi:magnesium chelatase family protein